VFAVGFTHPNAFSTSQTRKTLAEIFSAGSRFAGKEELKLEVIKNGR